MNSVFIHIPRTAGRYIIASLGLERHIYKNRIANKFKQEGRITIGHQDYVVLLRKGLISKEFHDSAFKFTFCRNPLDRLVSHYFHARSKHPEILPKDVSFRDFVMNLKEYNIPRGRGTKRTFRPQYQSVKRIELDFIGRYERLEEDLQKVADIIGVKLKNARPMGTTRHEPYENYYDLILEKKAKEFYKSDYEFFGY